MSKSDYGTVTLEDYSVDVKKVIKDKAIQFLQEAGEEVLNATIRNYDRAGTDTGQTKGSFSKVMDEGNLAVHIGSDFQNAIWEEFGTGEFAEKKDGRKGWWVFVKGSSKGTGGKVYATKEEAKKAMAILRKKGLDAYYTRGKRPRHQFRNAYTSTKNKIIKHAQQVFGGI